MRTHSGLAVRRWPSGAILRKAMKPKTLLAGFLAAPAALSLVALSLVLFAFVARPAAGAGDTSHAELKDAAVSVSALQPGKPAMAVVVLEIKPGFHAHSNTP